MKDINDNQMRESQDKTGRLKALDYDLSKT